MKKRKILIGAAASGLVLMLIFVWNFLSGSTPKTVDSTGEGTAISVYSLEKIELGGMEQWILVRGKNIDNPVLLWLHGGPGAAQIPIARHFNGDLEDDFVVVHWDQRGAGKSNPADFDENTMTFEQFIQDAHQFTQHLKARFNQEKIYLVGHSWGSYLGIMLARDYPQDYAAYVAVSQVVESAKGAEVSYHWLRKQIEEKGSLKDLEKLDALGPYPYTDHSLYVQFAKLVGKYGGGMDVGMGLLTWIALRAPEYRIGDYMAWLRGANRGSGPMWEETSRYDMFRDVPELLLPVYFIQGANDYNTPLQLVEEYLETLHAPYGKTLIVFEESSHAPFMHQPQRFNSEIVTIKDLTWKKGEQGE